MVVTRSMTRARPRGFNVLNRNSFGLILQHLSPTNKARVATTTLAHRKAAANSARANMRDPITKTLHALRSILQQSYSRRGTFPVTSDIKLLVGPVSANDYRLRARQRGEGVFVLSIAVKGEPLFIANVPIWVKNVYGKTKLGMGPFVDPAKGYPPMQPRSTNARVKTAFMKAVLKEAIAMHNKSPPNSAPKHFVIF